MKWVKEKKQWVAVGKFGKFIITQYSKMYYAKYDGCMAFNLPPNKSIKKVKEMCENNYYWEY